MSEGKEKLLWQERASQGMDELFPRVYQNWQHAKRLFQRLVDAPTLDARLMLASEIDRLIPVGGKLASPLPVKLKPGLRREKESPAGKECPRCGWYGAVHACLNCEEPICLNCFFAFHGLGKCAEHREPGMEG
jgi:hypothetical protein